MSSHATDIYTWGLRRKQKIAHTSTTARCRKSRVFDLLTFRFLDASFVHSGDLHLSATFQGGLQIVTEFSVDRRSHANESKVHRNILHGTCGIFHSSLRECYRYNMPATYAACVSTSITLKNPRRVAENQGNIMGIAPCWLRVPPPSLPSPPLPARSRPQQRGYLIFFLGSLHEELFSFFCPQNDFVKNEKRNRRNNTMGQTRDNE